MPNGEYLCFVSGVCQPCAWLVVRPYKAVLPLRACWYEKKGPGDLLQVWVMKWLSVSCKQGFHRLKPLPFHSAAFVLKQGRCFHIALSVCVCVFVCVSSQTTVWGLATARWSTYTLPYSFSHTQTRMSGHGMTHSCLQPITVGFNF